MTMSTLPAQPGDHPQRPASDGPARSRPTASVAHLDEPYPAMPVRRIGIGTMFRIEFRKLVDTWAGKLLLAGILGIVAVICAWLIFRQDGEQVNFADFGRAQVNVVGLLAPVIGLMAITAEWTQRTALTTFTLMPRRGQVLLAKVLASLVLTIATIAASLLLTAGSAWLAGQLHGGGVSVAGAADVVRSTLIVGALTTVMASAFGALVAQTAIAVALYFLAPTAYSMISQALFPEAAKWLDVFSAFDRLSSTHPGADLPATLLSITVWIVIPAVVGFTWAMRREVK
ncbi:ABC transporter permease subunit [Nakamurella aerolata]|uniref:ABC transporter permease subunit n=1 Tax=Nakamurella aerolata TaxID=1656892 RepID=A0A849A5R5_9ACTN|nr:ABC transporter permease subunit [Nakamurella aerolata]NNG34361.1 ABC transporter permease subunit [Nakamurella aerolata]